MVIGMQRPTEGAPKPLMATGSKGKSRMGKFSKGNVFMLYSSEAQLKKQEMEQTAKIQLAVFLWPARSQEGL